MLDRFNTSEDGAITAFNLFMFATVCIVGGLTLDVSNAYKVRTQLQIAADTASHAALYNRIGNTADEAKSIAVHTASYNLGLSDTNPAITASDVVFGTWDDTTRTFTPDANSKSAVRVSVVRDSARSNPVATYLLNFIGMNDWDLSAQSVSVTYRPACLREGFVADGVVDIQSNNGFYNGFCMHSNTYISLNQNNYFEAGTIVSMPNLDNLDMPASGFVKNDGLEEALREAFYQVRIVKRIDDIIASLLAGESTYMPDYITNTTVANVSGKTLGTGKFTQGRVHKLLCNQGNSVTIENNSTLKNMVIISSCPVNFGNGVVLEDVVFGNTSTNAKSFDSPSGVQLGKDDNCAVGGGVQILTMGGTHFASKMETYGAQIIAAGTVEFTAQADGIEGTSIISGQEISGTSNMTMGLCGTGMEDNFELDYYRVAG